MYRNEALGSIMVTGLGTAGAAELARIRVTLNDADGNPMDFDGVANPLIGSGVTTAPSPVVPNQYEFTWGVDGLFEEIAGFADIGSAVVEVIDAAGGESNSVVAQVVAGQVVGDGGLCDSALCMRRKPPVSGPGSRR